MRFVFALAFIVAVGFAAHPACAQQAGQTLVVDARLVAQGVIRAKLTVPVSPGPLTLVYPRWIPGEHGPNGAINELAALRMSANGAPIPWQRDTVDLYAFHLNVPAGALRLDVSLDYLLAGSLAPGGKERTTTSTLAMLNWYTVMLSPQGGVNADVRVIPSIILPNGWDYATALDARAKTAARIDFREVSFETLADSPLLTGAHMKKIVLASTGGTNELDLAGETENAVAIAPETIDKYKNLVAETDALFGARHWRNYHFLVALTDLIDFNGIEHHESSDDRAAEAYMTDLDVLHYGADLLPHEFTHSWNGKYRRPADLAVANFQDPEQTDLLWVYEGLTQYLGDVFTHRSGLRATAEYPEALARIVAQLETQTGRQTRPLVDTAIMAPFLYTAAKQFSHERRDVAFYSESELIWLEADTIVRQQSAGTKSLDDFCKAFHGAPASGPQVKTYTRADVIATLNAIAPYDWGTFFRERIDALAIKPPLGGIERAGWHVTYNNTPGRLDREGERFDKTIDATESIGLQVKTETGDVQDVIDGSPASRAGLAPFMKIVAVDGRRFSADGFHAALKAAVAAKAPIVFIVDNFGSFSTIDVEYHGGERYAHLERTAGKPDLLAEIAKAHR